MISKSTVWLLSEWLYPSSEAIKKKLLSILQANIIRKALQVQKKKSRNRKTTKQRSYKIEKLPNTKNSSCPFLHLIALPPSKISCNLAGVDMLRLVSAYFSLPFFFTYDLPIIFSWYLSANHLLFICSFWIS